MAINCVPFQDKVTPSITSKSDSSIPSMSQQQQQQQDGKFPWAEGKWGKADEPPSRIESSLSDGSNSSSLVKEKQLLTSELRELERERFAA